MLTDFEKIVFNDLTSETIPEYNKGTEVEQLLHFGIWAIYRLGLRIRYQRIHPFELNPGQKKDGSPFTEFEQQIEKQLRDWIKIRFPEASLVGEESGGSLTDPGITFVIDPVDGTWSFLTHTETCTTTISILIDGSPIIGLVLNPATGELGYGVRNQQSRLIQFPIGEGNLLACDLPIKSVNDKILINLHSSKIINPLFDKLILAWKDGKIKLVRSMSGSPAWGILEASKGFITYINMWDSRSTELYDLIAAVRIIRGAGGNIVNALGNPISETDHTGLFIAGIHQEQIDTVLSLI